MGPFVRTSLVAAALTLAGTAGAVDKATCISAADQAQTMRDDGKYRTARERLLTCSKPECPKAVSGACSKWLRDLDDQMPSVVIGARERASDLTEVTVTFDGEPLLTTLDGKPIAVDPGTHKLRFEHSGSESLEMTVMLKAGEKNRVITAMLHPTAAVAPRPDDATPTPPVAPQAEGNTQVARFAIGGSFVALAAGALATGIYFGVASKDDSDQAAQIRSGMPASACVVPGVNADRCNALASAVDAQNRDATLNIAMYVTSGVLALASILTFMLWPKPTKHEEPKATTWVVPLLGPSSGVAMGGRF